MPIRSRAAAAAVHILTALCAAVGVVLQCGFFGGRLNLAALQYFTLMSNILCAVYFAGAAVRTLRRGDTWLPVCKGALVMAMAITGITFHLFLAAGDFNMGPTQLITNHLLHTAAPLLTVLDWLLFDEKGHYRRFEPFLWGIFPAAYFVYTMIRARVSSFRFYNGSPYPYPFMDVDALGWGKVLRRSQVISRLYMLLVIPLSWMLFAIPSLKDIGSYIGRLFAFSGGTAVHARDFLVYGRQYAVVLVIGLLVSTPLPEKLWRRIRTSPLGTVLLLVLFWVCVYCMAVATNDPFMYFSF